ncbi:hypothetical protein B0H16DRAFT_1723712 [Mycena metata]|uniref:Uncharacterized protein n=1 Tax=Mycena metata TaxID=1033252 RepID=A0AAD7NA98_9AGAR|nr:hypothetical protein B0H16DRAFT_1723712 [Mycena metata]
MVWLSQRCVRDSLCSTPFNLPHSTLATHTYPCALGPALPLRAHARRSRTSSRTTRPWFFPFFVQIFAVFRTPISFHLPLVAFPRVDDFPLAISALPIFSTPSLSPPYLTHDAHTRSQPRMAALSRIRNHNAHASSASGREDGSVLNGRGGAGGGEREGRGGGREGEVDAVSVVRWRCGASARAPPTYGRGGPRRRPFDGEISYMRTLCARAGQWRAVERRIWVCVWERYTYRMAQRIVRSKQSGTSAGRRPMRLTASFLFAHAGLVVCVRQLADYASFVVVRACGVLHLDNTQLTRARSLFPRVKHPVCMAPLRQHLLFARVVSATLVFCFLFFLPHSPCSPLLSFPFYTLTNLLPQPPQKRASSSSPLSTPSPGANTGSACGGAGGGGVEW